MRAGIALSAAAHAALIALAISALPWLRVRPEPPLPAITVTLVGPGGLAARVRPAAPPEPPPAPIPAPVAPPPSPPAAAMPPPEPAPKSLAPAFDPEAPFSPSGLALGQALALVAPEPPPADLSEPPLPRPDGSATDPALASEPPLAAPAPPPGPVAAAPRPQPAPRASFEAEIRAAIARAKTYPKPARDRGIEGAARLEISVAREGRLLQAKILRSSGDPSLDEAALDAARRARLPAAPPDLPGASFRLEVGVSFELTGG